VQSKEGKYYSTLNGEKVRSKSEQHIADWLYRHSIRYEYEPLLNVKDFDFHPDFYIPDANLYIEHVSNISYSTRDKEEQFRLGRLTLIKTFEKMMEDSIVFNHRLDQIFKNHLPENYVPRTLLFREEFNRYYEEIKDFIRLVMRITDMMKVENKNIDEIFQNSQKDQHERVRTFYKAAIPIIKKYVAYCVNKSFLDFNDLISTTIQLFKSKQDITDELHRRFKYILVDEFQDVNNLQVELVKLLLTDKTQLFCVGDDWQSIYGFRGSNVSYIVEFEKHFPDAEVIKLNLNYRSTQHIVGASNEVIKHNKFKVEKDISALKLSEQKIIVYSGSEDDENVDFCVEKIKELLKSGVQPDDIMFLYRRSKMFSPYISRFKDKRIRVQGKTIHAAKGLESKVVFIIGLSEGPGGFPDIWLEDRIFQVIKKSNFDLLMEEERRLFYVAITRARDKLFLITDKGNESSFLKEIPQHYLIRTGKQIKSVIDTALICPSCHSSLEKLTRHCPNCGVKLLEND
jgi:superfamily I DNA/RNA helicase